MTAERLNPTHPTQLTYSTNPANQPNQPFEYVLTTSYLLSMPCEACEEEKQCLV